MTGQLLFMAGVLALAAAPTQGAEGDGAPQDSPVDSLVLVLNIISTTHAKPVTGVVLARPSASDPALVLVPADFVSAGDEIIVLDGGTDILRDGRESRTVARSTELGVAVLEVAGLARRGVELSSDDAPAAGTLEFAAWPAAEKLAGGERLLRRSVQLRAGAGATGITIEPGLPDLAGPLFDACGQLAAFHRPGNQGGPLDGSGLSQFLAASGLKFTRSPCARTSTSAAAPGAAPGPEATEPAAPGNAPEPQPIGDAAPGQSMLEAARPPGDLAGVLAVALLGLTTVLVYLRIRSRPATRRILLEATHGADRRLNVELRLRPGQNSVSCQQQDCNVVFQAGQGRLWISDRADDDTAIGLALGDTPCLPGEVFAVDSGDEISLGSRSFVLRLSPPDAWPAESIHD